MRIRDLVYFDFEKAASIWSQIEGGLLEKVSIAKEETGTTDLPRLPYPSQDLGRKPDYPQRNA